MLIRLADTKKKKNSQLAVLDTEERAARHFHAPRGAQRRLVSLEPSPAQQRHIPPREGLLVSEATHVFEAFR